MPDLLLHIPNHGYSISDTIFVSWLDANFFVRDEDKDPAIDADSFKISTDDSDDNIVQFTETITAGFVREVDVSAGTTTISGLDHLEGETVSIYADLLIESPEIVVSGGFTIDNAAARVLVGMPYTSKLETLPLVVDPQDKAFNKKIKRIWFDVYQTGALSYGNGANSTLTISRGFKNNLDFDNTAIAQDLDVGPATSVTRPLDFRFVYGSMKKQTVYVETSEPMPMTIRSITPVYDLIGN